MSFKDKNVDQINQKLEEVQKKADELKKVTKISFAEWFDEGFMKKYTKFESIDEMFEKSGFKCECNEDFEKIPMNEWEEYIQKTTKFITWKDMTAKAAEEYITRQLRM